MKRVWSTHLCDLHDLDSRQLAGLYVSPLVNLTICTIAHHLYQFKYPCGVLGGRKKSVGGNFKAGFNSDLLIGPHLVWQW